MLKGLKGFSVLVIACMMITMINVAPVAAYAPVFDVWDGSVDSTWASDYTGAGTGSSLYTITTAAQLARFRNKVWGGIDFSGKTVTLGANIDLDNLNWRFGIGGRFQPDLDSGSRYFRGTFNGDGYTIKNIHLNPNSPDQAATTLDSTTYGVNYMIGLFGLANSAATIKALNLENISITIKDAINETNGMDGTTGETSYGGLIGYANGTSILSCSVKNVSFNGGWNCTGTARVSEMAGLAGKSISAKIRNCYVNGVDFTNVHPGDMNFNSYKAGITVAAGGNATSTNACLIKNAYAVNMRYDLTATNTEAIQTTNQALRVMNSFNSAVLLMKTGVSPSFYYSSLKTNALAHLNSSNIYVDVYEHVRGATHTAPSVPEETTAEVFTSGTQFYQDGTNKFMIDLRDYGIEYPVTASERLIASKVDLYDGANSVASLSAVVGDNITAKVKNYNTTGSEQLVDLIIASYATKEMKNLNLEPITANSIVKTADANYGNYISDAEFTTKTTTQGTVNLPKTGVTSVSSFCWDSLSSLIPLAQKHEIK